uniref:G-protein coupled receptors family 1 profile domain-containing protein n=1 Tax=Gasterosteus aculeatus aculeatus TaxID=481459 RepID=G3PMX2_GASAC
PKDASRMMQVEPVSRQRRDASFSQPPHVLTAVQGLGWRMDAGQGAFCIPVYIPYNLTGRWMLGKGVCKVWLIMDYLLCTASVFNIVLISYDRFLSVTRAVKYRAQRNMTRPAVFKMVAVWALAFLLYGPAIIFWEAAVGQSVVPAHECYAEFYFTWYFLLSASTFEFFAPFVSVAFFNLSIYLNIHQRTKTVGAGVEEEEEEDIADALSPSSCGDADNTTQASRLSRDKKIAKSLAIIVCIFGICWAPYTLLMIIRAACSGECVANHWYDVTFWLLWLNSAINPFLYPLCHSSFRRAFAKILCPKRQSSHRTPMAPNTVKKNKCLFFHQKKDLSRHILRLNVPT